MSVDLLLAVHLAATAAMGGLIWFVQLVHYPLFAAVGADGFAAYEVAHQARTSWVVGPLMLVETATAIGLNLVDIPGGGPTLPAVALGVLALVHLSTVSLQVPAHKTLSNGFDARVVRRLVATNWIRTAGWTIRTVLAAVLVAQAS